MSLTKVPSAMTELTGTTFNGEVRSYDSADQANFVGGVSGTANRIQIRGASHPSTPNVMTMDLGSGEVLRYTTTTKTEFGYPSFNCRAWVNFNGTGTVAIRASGNVSSITDNGTGDYTVNFTSAMVDANYSAQYMLSESRQFIKSAANGGADPTTSQFRFQSLNASGGAVDAAFNFLAFFR